MPLLLLGGPGRAWGSTKRPSKAVAPIVTGRAATILAAIATSHSAATERRHGRAKKGAKTINVEMKLQILIQI